MHFVDGPNTCTTNPRWPTAAILEKSPYICNGLTDCHEIWHGDAVWASWVFPPLKHWHSGNVITRRRSFAEYWKYFVACFNDVHVFGYNFAGSERIWMKFGELRVYCLELSLTNFGHDPRRSGSGRASRNFVFFGPLNNARFHRLPVGQISRNLHKKTCFRVLCWGFGKHLW